jgi:hypothetical protein
MSAAEMSFAHGATNGILAPASARIVPATDMPAPARSLPLAAWRAMEYVPNAWAMKHIHSRHERWVVGCTCRQCGKSTGMAAEIQDAMTQPPDPSGDPPEVGVMAVDYPRAQIPVFRWRDWVQRAFGADIIESQNLNEHLLVMRHTGAKLRWFSAEAAASAAGYTFSHFFYDESQWIPDEAWTKTRPAFNARSARVKAFGTPDISDGSTWFQGLWLRGQDEEELDHYSFRVSVFENPWITMDEIASMREDMTEDEFRMLALGQWVNLGGAVFKRFKHCITGGFEWKANEGPYVIGLDLAKQRDYTVAYVMDLSRNAVVHKWRINGLPYDEVEDKIEELYRHYGAMYVHLDNTGVGEPVADHLVRKGVPVRPFVFTNERKHLLVSNLNRMLQHGEIVLAEEDAQLVRELEVFTAKMTPAGNVQYTHPVNYFDDSIMALGLCALTARLGMHVPNRRMDSDYLGGGGPAVPDWFARIR